ncbi:MAG: Crp/Fnr family transcriptional regulator [Chloroflexi bacterium]|nr:Crp/Fnr family transcriptional regulator [Chloroflexota bacterium]MCL5110916.1 Crp/Fnr family transcriptional regulator [Chloroflexota bacterium]
MPVSRSASNTPGFLRSFPYFSSLGPDELAGLAAEVVIREYGKGELVALEGEPCRGLCLVRAGRVRVFKTSPDGRTQVLSMAGPGESFNEVPNFDSGPNPASVEALEPTTIFLLHRETVLRAVERYPSVALAMLNVFARRLRHLTGVVEDLSFRHVTSRLAKVLLQYAAEPAPGRGESGLTQRLTQQEMAAIVGTAREMVGRSLKALEAQGALRVERNRIIILNRDLLERIV